ncbi:MAG: hypothetical protein GX139_01300 [Armatimonadetes bacterium]|jgi:hypothetical protein|nr:hypothetical protein [Armatimonadota bacterium]
MALNTAPVGWQGIVVDAPTDWSLVGVNGDTRKGYFRVDSPIASALEVKWEKISGKGPDLEAKAKEFLANIEKSARKKKLKFDKDIKVDKADPYSVRFLWRSDRLGQGKLVYCPQCERMMIAQVISTRQENVSKTASEILDSIRDHRDDGWVEWGLYGLGFAIPPGYGIQKQTLMSGYLALNYKKGAHTIVVERWGLAGTLLAKDDMATWYRKDAMPDIKGYTVSVEAETIAGGEGLRISGRRKGIVSAVKALAYSLTLNPFPSLLTGFVWHQPEANRLFSVRVTHSANAHVAEKIRDSIIAP